MVKKNSDKKNDNKKNSNVIMTSFENLPAQFYHFQNHEQGYLTHD
jgi:hypothetical protein